MTWKYRDWFRADLRFIPNCEEMSMTEFQWLCTADHTLLWCVIGNRLPQTVGNNEKVIGFQHHSSITNSIRHDLQHSFFMVSHRIRWFNH